MYVHTHWSLSFSQVTMTAKKMSQRFHINQSSRTVLWRNDYIFPKLPLHHAWPSVNSNNNRENYAACISVLIRRAPMCRTLLYLLHVLPSAVHFCCNTGRYRTSLLSRSLSLHFFWKQSPCVTFSAFGVFFRSFSSACSFLNRLAARHFNQVLQSFYQVFTKFFTKFSTKFLPSFYQVFTKISQQFYEDFTSFYQVLYQVLSKFSPNFTKFLTKVYQVFSKFCQVWLIFSWLCIFVTCECSIFPLCLLLSLPPPPPSPYTLSHTWPAHLHHDYTWGKACCHAYFQYNTPMPIHGATPVDVGWVDRVDFRIITLLCSEFVLCALRYSNLFIQ